MTSLIHFVASWAEAICGPHRAEVRAAAKRAGLDVRSAQTAALSSDHSSKAFSGGREVVLELAVRAAEFPVVLLCGVAGE